MSEAIKLLRIKARIELAKSDFWEFCKLMHPKFYKDNRYHLRIICFILQGLHDGTLINKTTSEAYKKLMINIPPRFGKSFTLTLFSMWLFGQSIENQVITVSYNENLSGRFAKGVRDGISDMNINPDLLTRGVIFSDIFPDVKIKRGDAAVQMWALEGHFLNYLATSFGGTVTGAGCNYGIIDDPIKNSEEAYNDNALQKHYDFYTDTFLSRLEEGAKQIVNMTRWATKDLCGRLLKIEPDDWFVLKLEVLWSDGGVYFADLVHDLLGISTEVREMLCNDLMSKHTYDDKKKMISASIMGANYHQQPVDIKGSLYKKFNTYSILPADGNVKACNYTDTADTGTDFLCSICFIAFQGMAYVTDVVFSQDDMEITEPLTAEMLFRNGTNDSLIESNNGGRGFARNVKRILKDEKKSIKTNVRWFHQSKNKQARIFSNSATVQTRVLMPENWHLLFPEFYEDIMNFKREGKNLHDDGADTLTGVVEMMDDGDWEDDEVTSF